MSGRKRRRHLSKPQDDPGMYAIGRMLAERHGLTRRDREVEGMHADAVVTLRERRMMLGLSQRDVGELVGMSQEQISHYEHGRREPGLEALVRLCWALRLRLRFDRVEDMPGSAGAERKGGCAEHVCIERKS